MRRDQLDEDDCGSASVFSFQEPPEPLSLSVTRNGSADCSGIPFAPNSLEPDFFSFSHASLPVGHPPSQMMNGDQFYMRAPETNKLMGSFLNPNSLQNLQIDPCADNARSNVTKHLRVSEVTNSLGGPAEICQPKGRDIFNMFPPNIGSVHSSGLQNPALFMNFIPPGNNTNGGAQMARQGKETESKLVSRLPINRNHLSLGQSVAAMHHAMDLGQKGNTYDGNFYNNELGFPEQFDGSFLTLGTGNKQEVTSVFSTREIASKLEEVDRPESKHTHIQSGTRNPSSVACNWTGNMPSLQNNANGLSSVAFNACGWDTQLYPSVNSYGNSGYPGNSSLRFADTFSSRDIQGGQEYPVSHLFNSNSTYVSHSGSTELSGSASRSANPPWITQPFPNHLQNSFATNGISTPTESSISSRLPIHRGSQHFIGNPIPPSNGSVTQYFDSQHLMNTQPVGQLTSGVKANSVQSLYSHVPDRIQSQVTVVRSLQPFSNNSFPKRLGVQPDAAAGQAHNEGNVHQTQSFACAQLPRNLDGPAFELGWPQVNTTLQYNVHGSFPMGQIQGTMPVRHSQDHPRPDYTTGHVINVANVDASRATRVLIRPSVKRRATAPPTVASLTQRRKITPQSIGDNSTAYVHQSVPAPRPVPVSPAPRSKQAPPASLYIKWEGIAGIEGPPQPLGHKCLICKRDLSYAPEGPFQQPSIPPPVAVLSCGHTFHVHCLQIITPEDQSKDPPCIPCAIGET